MRPIEGIASTLRSEGIADTVTEAIAACSRSPHRETLAGLGRAFGFDGFSYIVLGSPSAQPRVVAHWSSCGAPWTARYAARSYHLVDPRVTMTRHRCVPVTWDASVGERDPHANEFLHDAARHDVRGGIAWSAHDARIGRAVVAWDTTRADAVPLGLRLGTIALLAGIVHEALVRHCDATATARGEVSLTARERQCMALVAHGMTSADIGTKLGITTRTANFHVGNVMSKLGAVSRGEAIARAVASRLVSVD